MVVALELAVAVDETLALVMAELLASRGATLLEEGTVEVLRPFVPGHQVLLVVASKAATVDVVESELRGGWASLTSRTTEDELAAVRRRVAAASAAEWSGATGRACRCAAVASGAVGWRTAADLEMSILSVTRELVDANLAGLADFGVLQNTGAGVLPIVTLDER